VTWVTATNARSARSSLARFAIGDTLTAVADPTGTVDVWRNSTYVGRTSAASAFTGGGRIGVRAAQHLTGRRLTPQTLP